jgi:cell division transport system permease protein
MFLSRRSDLPLKGDSASRFLPWLIAPMVFLSAVAMSGSFIIHDLIGRWERDTSSTMTIEIAASEGNKLESSAEQNKIKIDTTLRLLKSTPGVIAAKALTLSELENLLNPWLGSREMLRDLPLPTLIDVTVKTDGSADLSVLSDKLSRLVPGASIDDHRLWLARLVKFSNSVEKLAIGILLMIIIVTVSTILFAVKSGMAVHRDIIDIMHIIGASDNYITKQFAYHAFILGLKGGFIGLLITLPILLWIRYTNSGLKSGLILEVSLSVEGWICIILLPLFSSILSYITAWFSVNQALGKMS